MIAENHQIKLKTPCKCGCENGKIAPSGNEVHKAKLICSECDRFIKWIGKNDYGRIEFEIMLKELGLY